MFFPPWKIPDCLLFIGGSDSRVVLGIVAKAPRGIGKVPVKLQYGMLARDGAGSITELEVEQDHAEKLLGFLTTQSAVPNFGRRVYNALYVYVNCN